MAAKNRHVSSVFANSGDTETTSSQTSSRMCYPWCLVKGHLPLLQIMSRHLRALCPQGCERVGGHDCLRKSVLKVTREEVRLGLYQLPMRTLVYLPVFV